MNEVWINVRRTDGGQHDDMGFDADGLSCDSAAAWESWGLCMCLAGASITDWPAGRYVMEVRTGPERTGEKLAERAFKWGSVARTDTNGREEG